MARILGVDIPDRKRGEIALTYIYGIGRSLANKVLAEAQVDKDKHPAAWADEESKKIRAIISEQYKVEGELRSEVRLHIKRLMDIGCYRGKRHRVGLPVRGQKTKNNARTRKGNLLGADDIHAAHVLRWSNEWAVTIRSTRITTLGYDFGLCDRESYLSAS